MTQSCDEMGEEQDKFALAVMIFKLLNNGIHPFSGTPRKDVEMLTIQNRIEQYHYAYGLWPDTYQAPHPYSLHEYFAPKTLEFFERAFTRGGKRPSAEEWQNHLKYLLKNLKTCKKNPNHAYFTAKGCGLCAAEERLKGTLVHVQKQKETPQKLRGMEIASFSVENFERDKAEKLNEALKIKNFTMIGIAAYLLFFAFLFKIISPAENWLKEIGFGLQAVLITLLMFGINRFIKHFRAKLPLLQNRALTQMLQVYAFICILIALLFLNEFPDNLFMPPLSL